MPAEKRPRKDSVPCVAGSRSPTRASRGGVGYARSAPHAPPGRAQSGRPLSAGHFLAPQSEASSM
jgi:hypothetical protein